MNKQTILHIFSVLAILQAVLWLRSAQAQANELTFNPEILDIELKLPEPLDYKTRRLREMAETWKGTILESRTVPLLAMLLTEDGTLTAERRHDCHHGTCYAIGFQGHNICTRGMNRKHYCSWKNGKSPQQQFEEEHSEFASSWVMQFRDYTNRVWKLTEEGYSVDDIIWSWNSREVGRRAKVRSREAYVRKALDL